MNYIWEQVMHCLIYIVLLLPFLFVMANNSISSENLNTVGDTIKKTAIITYPQNGRQVDQTVAKEFQKILAPQSEIFTTKEVSVTPNSRVIRISIIDENFSKAPENISTEKPWMYFRLTPEGEGELVVSKPHLLYTLFCQIRDNWASENVSHFKNGKLVEAKFQWVTGEDKFFGRRRRFSRNYDPESCIKELARIGASHVVVNALPTPFAYEQGPAGEIYYRFYTFSPDVDQYVETKLNKGTYPPEYLKANLEFLKKQAQLAVKYGLTPGMHVSNPRSVPESLLEKYPYLRGARVDHTFRSYKPRYTLTLAHPLVRWHYAQLIKKLLKEVPEIGFYSILINDCGSGFEYTASLYPGRNGGPYVVREWRTNEEIAEAAAKNVIRYYRTIRDAAREINPEFRIITTLKNIAEEAAIIQEGMDNGIDMRTRTQRSEVKEDWHELNKKFLAKESYIFSGASAQGSPYILGVPSPRLTFRNLNYLHKIDFNHIEVDINPYSLSPYDVNREVLRAVLFDTHNSLDDVLEKCAINWVGENFAQKLIEIWKYSDRAVQAMPPIGLYAASGFTWFRIWDRPFVPDIGKILQKERQYYEDYMLTVFNNPNNVDFQKDALWELLSIEQCEQFIKQFDTHVWNPLDHAIAIAQEAVEMSSQQKQPETVFIDVRDRLIAYRCYSKTLRNICAWIAGVHGYLDAKDEAVKKTKLKMVREMVANELQNAKELLKLWESSSVDFMPIYRYGENGHDYGPNFGEVLKKKIELMEKYGDSTPYIDPNYMWRMPDESDDEQAVDIDESEYLKYK